MFLIHVHCDYVLPLSFQNGLSYLAIRSFMDSECEKQPRMILTSDAASSVFQNHLDI